MNETLISLLPEWGPWLLAIITFLSCLLLPAPATLMMIAGGALVATGDLSLPAITLAALAGALLGDQVVFAAGRRLSWVVPKPESARGAKFAQARAELERNGGYAVFLTRWLFSPVGPWLNLAAGAAGFSHRRFTLAVIAGEIFWVTIYTGLGYLFAANLAAATDIASSALGLMAALVLLLGFAWRLRAALRKRGN